MRDVFIAPEQLADSRRAGVFRCGGEVAQAAVTAATQQRFTAASLDLAEADHAGLFSGFAAALRFPEWFGANWDALADCLGDLSWLEAPGYLLVLRDASNLHRRLGTADFDTLIEILNEAAAGWREQGVPFWILLENGPSNLPTIVR
ncbi:barstar family protein [Niveibacterium sp. SC-1]|uniref:barstar family protein n=1 Tax=Niveibacterium sp. SC-1 TaxID=3135646 RepID=UPI00311F5ABC